MIIKYKGDKVTRYMIIFILALGVIFGVYSYQEAQINKFFTWW